MFALHPLQLLLTLGGASAALGLCQSSVAGFGAGCRDQAGLQQLAIALRRLTRQRQRRLCGLGLAGKIERLRAIEADQRSAARHDIAYRHHHRFDPGR